ncbi:hypothetical protein [Flavivirga eckloniae]|uniref:STAS/SEC14 domain-containing protein n=1 Tax=Flavivirga eckloniae TaxID=1803846 RepID=A0A2K9PKB4_9FLAO|nr:hypothetical protein [Flavivirga eckloniae]AUP77475.1 hypothetical protein C1H87_01555 [Flavivirga eckloniae]
MKFENSLFSNELNYYKLQMSFGNFFLFEKFIISELGDGVHIDWPKIKTVTNEVLDFYGENAKIGYISNRINSYSIDPCIWTKVYKKYNKRMVGGSIVSYNRMMCMNASFEKMFSRFNIKVSLSLNEALNWVTDLDELY